jgi:hypothetical protein
MNQPHDPKEVSMEASTTNTDDVREVSFEDALAEEAQNEDTPRPRPPAPQPTIPESAIPESETIQVDTDQTPVSDTPVAETPESVAEQRAELEEELEDLEPAVAAKEWTFGEGESARSYIQCELSVIGSAQWFKLLGEVLEEAMTGENALSLNSILSPPTPTGGQLQLQDFQEADMFVTALGKLLTVMPEFLEKSICIWLDVPDYEQELVNELMRRSPTRGGMSHDMFEEIVTVFIDQNYAEIDRFFRERFPRLRDRYRARAKEASRSRSQRR